MCSWLLQLCCLSDLRTSQVRTAITSYTLFQSKLCLENNQNSCVQCREEPLSAAPGWEEELTESNPDTVSMEEKGFGVEHHPLDPVIHCFVDV